MVGDQMTSKDQTVTDQTLSPSEQLAQALLLEQVRYFKQQLTGEHSPEYLQHITHLIFNTSQHLTLGQVVSLEQLQDVVKRYALEMQLGAGLLEFIGEIAQKIYLYTLQSTATVNDLVSDYQFEIWLSKFLELDNVRVYLNQFLKSSPAIQQLCQFIATTVLQISFLYYLQPQTPKVSCQNALSLNGNVNYVSFRAFSNNALNKS
jgi:hypothetical protein